MALTFDDKRKALGKKLIEEINKPAPIPERHLLRDKTREIVSAYKRSQSERISPEKMREIADEIMPDSWTRER